MDVKIVSSITRLANYMPLGSYVIYTALETYSFSLGAMPAPVKTIVQTPTANFTCYFVPGASFTYTSCTSDQSSALKISLAIGFFLAVFLSFLKQIPAGGTPPLAEDYEEEEDHVATPQVPGSGTVATAESGEQKTKKKPKKRRIYRRGVLYAEGNFYYLDFGDYHIWGHAALSLVAFGTLSLFSASVSQCLFPDVRPWIFVFTQVVLLVICCFIAMFWIDDPTLSIGLMVATPNPDPHNHNPHRRRPGTTPAPAPGTSAPPISPPPADEVTITAPVMTTMGLPTASAARTSALMSSAMSLSSMSALSGTTAIGGGFGQGGVSRMLFTRRASTISSVSEKVDLEQEQEQDQYQHQQHDPNLDHEHSKDARDPEKGEEHTAGFSGGIGDAKVSGHFSLRMD